MCVNTQKILWEVCVHLSSRNPRVVDFKSLKRIPWGLEHSLTVWAGKQPRCISRFSEKPFQQAG